MLDIHRSGAQRVAGLGLIERPRGSRALGFATHSGRGGFTMPERRHRAGNLQRSQRPIAGSEYECAGQGSGPRHL